MNRMGWIAGCLVGIALGAMADEQAPPPPKAAMLHGRAGGLEKGGDLMMLMRPAVIKQLDLSAEQQARIAEVSAVSSNEIGLLRTKMLALAAQQVKLMGAESVDEAAVLKLAGEIGDVRKSMSIVQIKQMLAAHKLMTPEQRQKMRGMMKKLMDRHEGDQPGLAGKRDRKGGVGNNRPALPPPPAE